MITAKEFVRPVFACPPHLVQDRRSGADQNEERHEEHPSAKGRSTFPTGYRNSRQMVKITDHREKHLGITDQLSDEVIPIMSLSPY